MKKYRVSIIDWSIENDRTRLNKIITKYVTGLKAVRELCPPIHYNRNANAWMGYNGHLEYIACEIARKF